MYSRKSDKFIHVKAVHNIFILLLAAIVMVRCSESDSTNPGSNPQPEPGESINLAEIRQEIALHIANHFILPGYEELENDVEALTKALNEFVNVPTEANLTLSQEELRKLWISWQNIALFQIGPAETNALRLAINTYPTDTGKIESNIQSTNVPLASIDNRDAVGLPAIDYLLNKNLDEGQTNLDLFINNAERGLYLIALAEELTTKIGLVATEWRQNNYLNLFTANTAAGTDVGSALGQVVNSIDVHFQQFLRDGKVAIPAGVRSAGIPRPRAVEALYGGYGRELLVAAINSYINLFEGRGIDRTEGTSIIDYLEAIDHSSIGVDIQTSLKGNLTRAQSLNQNLSVQIEENNELMIDLFIDLQKTITLIKSDMSSVMGITITNQDNDGD